MNLYAQELTDHFKNPKNKRSLSNASMQTEEFNPSCGDLVKFYANIDDQKRFTEITFEGAGCVISLATASMLTDVLINRNISEVFNFDSQKITELVKINLGPTRLKCAMLPLEALQKGVSTYLNS